MVIYCMDCEENTGHKYIGTNPDNGLLLYQCFDCDGRQETEEDDA
jgi:hypothetical protein